MKCTLSRSLSIAVVSAMLSISTHAFAGDAAEAPKEIVVIPSQGKVVEGLNLAAMHPRSPKMEKVAYLGVGVGEAPQVLTEQLKLPNGVGLVVEFVEKDSPAEKAGLQSRDVLHKMDEQLLINTQQFATLVRTFKPGAEVKLTVLRKGEPVTLNATLIEKEMPELTSSMQAFTFNAEAPALAGFGSTFPMRVHVEAHGDHDNDGAEAGGGAGTINSTKARIIRVMPGSSSKIIKVDGDLRIEINTKDGMKSLKIDRDGKTLFDGPLNTPDEVEKVPAELREKVKATEDGIELKEVPATSPAQPKAEADPVLGGGPAT